MFISDSATKRPMVTVIVMVALVLFGLFALLRLEADEFPGVEQPILLLGVTVIGGVITSTLLTLLVIPAVYELFDTMRDRAAAPFRRRRAARAHAHDDERALEADAPAEDVVA